MFICKNCIGTNKDTKEFIVWRSCRNTRPICEYGLPFADFVEEKEEEKEKPKWLEGVIE